MSRHSRIRLSVLDQALMGLTLFGITIQVPLGAQAQTRPYLDWPGKPKSQRAAEETAPATPLQRALPNAATGQSGFDIPPSPYGQVGNPYRHELNWRGKTAPVSAQAAAPETPSQTAPKTELASNWTPVPQSRFDAPRRTPPAAVTPPAQPAPQKSEALSLPAPQTPVANPVPLPQPKPPVVSAETVARETAPVATVKPVPVPPVPTPPVQAQAAAPAPVQPQPRPDSGYRLPANSKYAGRVSPELEGRPAVPAQAAAPVAQKTDAPKAQAQTTAEAKPAPTAKTPAAKASAPKAGAKTTDTKTAEAKPADVKTATAPAATAPLAQAAEQESAEPYTPFVPGSRATTASQAPRFYSLHRAYGYEPDPAQHTGGDLALDPNAVQTPAQDKTPAAASKAQKTAPAAQPANPGDTPPSDPKPAKDKTL